MRNMDKKTYRLKCRILARKVAKMKLRPHQIPEYLSRQKWFMEIQGVVLSQKGQTKFAKGGAYRMFGKEWCDECMREELVHTGSYAAVVPTKNPKDIDSYYDVSLIGESIEP